MTRICSKRYGLPLLCDCFSAFSTYLSFMYIGHFGAAFALRGLAAREKSPAEANQSREPSLAALFIAAQLPDILSSAFCAAHWESVWLVTDGGSAFPYAGSYPWSHSLAATLFWAAIYGAGFTRWCRDRRAGILIALGVFSHFILDFVSHMGDLAPWPGAPATWGLGLWRSLPGIVFTESAIFLGGLAYYLRSGARFDRTRLARLCAFLIISHGATMLPVMHKPDVSSVPLGPLFLALAYWAWRVENFRPAQ